MTIRFVNWRLAFYVAVLIVSITVLGIDAHLASMFLPNLHQDFTIFALVIPSLTILAFFLTYQWSQPRIEAPILFVLGSLWIGMGAWADDIIGFVQCDGLAGRRTATKTGDMSAQAYCYEMKIIEAFSWLLFCLIAIAFLILLRLVTQAQGFGRVDIWRDPIQELGWFHEYPGWFTSPGQQTMQYHPMNGMGGMNGIYPPQQQQPGGGHAGQTLLIQPHPNGGAPTVTTLPYGAAGGLPNHM
ncbi:hypothetical protein CYLTODRAFT_418808 [Cylindrobasidium torrendii FP15055 ss-10]|uniref:MARVEL domain-containing protein n=1 Tax=Cylindrobasidium torrendii FP15055 ss-10 TaxID=1314674 RepID=A0A0D7BMI1_9AGAR|nr:hypothetical protein CYLTODRAFT_418808 [Cylindrobasidium torrendii FP15055 ss-10]